MNKKIASLKSKKKRLMEKLHDYEYFIRGSITTIKHKCGNKNCKCYSGGEKHAGKYFSTNINKKTKLIYLGEKKVAKAKKLLINHSKLKKILDDILVINIDILKLED